MNKCVCYHDNIDNINIPSMVDEDILCSQCGKRVYDADVISLLVKEVDELKQLKDIVQKLESERQEREYKKFEEEELENKRLKRLNSASDRFEMLDL